MPVEIEMLRKIPYFSALTSEDLARVAMLTVERHFNRGELILIAGETEMAALVGSTREVVGRALKELETAGAIEMRHGQAMVLNQERLRIITF